MAGPLWPDLDRHEAGDDGALRRTVRTMEQHEAVRAAFAHEVAERAVQLFLHRLLADERFHAEQLRTIDAKLASLPPAKLIVLFRFSPQRMSPDEPVYNPDVLYPDNSPIIRAHDRGERNIELYRYYAERQPDRIVYLYDRADDSLTELGNVVELARRSR